MSSPNPPVRVHYAKSPDHRNIYVDGAIHRYTGVNNFALDFYIGMYDINDELFRDKDQKTERMILVPDEVPYTREIQSTIIMTPEVAQALCDLLTAKLKDYKDMIGENDEQ